MTPEEMQKDYPRLRLEYTRLHADYRRLLGILNKKQSESVGAKLYCEYCGRKKEHKIFTDANTELVCKNQLCPVNSSNI